MATEFHRILAGAIISLALAIYAFRREALSATGTLAAVLLGVSVFWLGGTDWFIVLAAFLITSILFTRFKEAEKQDVVKQFAKGGTRDFWQVLANGGIAGILAIAFFYYHDPIIFYAFLGVIGTVTADTWATELGILGKRKPRLITTLKSVPIGTSGAVSTIGLAITLAAGVFIGAVAHASISIFGTPLSAPAHPLLLVLAISGVAAFIGSLADSLLGATVQVMYYSKHHRKETERSVMDGEKTTLIRGHRWLDNDIVNLAASIAGGLAAAGLYLLLA